MALIKDLDKPLPGAGIETVIYDKPNGDVYYDGNGGRHPVLIATLNNHAVLHINDILLI